MENLTIDFIAFYPTKIKDKKNFEGSLHIYIENFDMDVRGIKVFVKNSRAFAYLPSQFAIHSVTKKKVKFPIISFMDRNKKENFITTLRKGLTKFIKTEMEDYYKTKKEDSGDN